MLFALSRMPVTSQTAPMPTAPTPSSERRSGPSTARAPKSIAGSTTNQTERRTRRSPTALTSARSGRDRAECPAGSGDGGDPAQHGAEQRAADRRRERLADQRAAPAGRRGRDEPRQRAGPREGARQPLAEAREVELPRGVGDAEEG